MVVDLRSGAAVQGASQEPPPAPALGEGKGEVAADALGAAGASADSHDGYADAQRSQAAAPPAEQDAAAAEEAALEAALLEASGAGAPESAQLPPADPPGCAGSGENPEGKSGSSGAVPERESGKEKKSRRRAGAAKDAVKEGGVAKERSAGRRGRGGHAANADRSKAAGSGAGAAGLSEIAAGVVSPDGDALPGEDGAVTGAPERNTEG
jgi:hypothetical protein